MGRVGGGEVGRMGRIDANNLLAAAIVVSW